MQSINGIGGSEMKFTNWTLDALIEYLIRSKSAPEDRLDPHCVPRVHGEIHIENGELISKERSCG